MSSSQEILGALRKLEDNLAERLGQQMDALRLEMNARFDAIEVRLDRLETEYQMITAALRRIEERLDAHDAERDQLRTDVAALKARVAHLNERIQAIESKLED